MSQSFTGGGFISGAGTAGKLAEFATANTIQAATETGTGDAVRGTSPTLVTPVLGTPSSGTLTSCTGLPEAGLTLADNTTADASTTKHGFLLKAVAPASPTINLVGIENGATVYSIKAASSAPGAAAKILQTPADGIPTLVGLKSTANSDATHTFATDGTIVALASGGGVQNNALINGGFDWWQRYAVPATLAAVADDVYFTDRWYCLTSGGATDIQAARTAGDTSGQYAAQMKQTNASAKLMGLAQIVESNNSVPYRSRSVRLQFRMKASTNTNFKAAILEWTSTADAVTSDVVKDWTSTTYTANNFFLASNLTVTAVSGSLAVTTAYADFSLTGTLGASCNNLVLFVWTEAGVAQNVTFDITQAQLFDGISAQAWLPRPAEQEYALCRFYFQKTVSGLMGIMEANAYTTTNARGVLVFTPMRGTPTFAVGTAANWLFQSSNANFAVSAVSSIGTIAGYTWLTWTVATCTNGYGGVIAAATAGEFYSLTSEL